MRNLKRALSLALASVMLLGMMVVGSSAASFTDVAGNDHEEAIEVMNLLGIMEGTGEEIFEPDRVVTRNEMAVVMVNLLDLKLNGAHPFTDVPEWADKYVAAIYTNGYTAGKSATVYGGADQITAVEAALMVMKTLGYFEFQGEFGDDWKLATIKRATELKLFEDIDAGINDGITRGEVAEMVLAALDEQVKIARENGGMTVEGNGITVTEKPTYNYSVAYATLYEKLFDKALYVDETATDSFGRPATSWTFDGDTVTVADEPLAVYAGADFDDETMKDDFKKWDIFYDISYNGDLGGTITQADLEASRKGYTIEVYGDEDEKIVDKFVVIEAYAAQIEAINTNDDDEVVSVDINVYEAATGTTTLNVDVENDEDAYALIKDLAEDEVFAITLTSGWDTGIDEDDSILAVDEVEVVEGTVGTISVTPGYNGWVKVDGVKYEFAWEYSQAAVTKEADGAFYLYNGYVIHFDGEVGEADTEYVYVVRSGSKAADFGGTDKYCEVVYADGTTEIIDTKEEYPAGVYAYEYDDDNAYYVLTNTTTDEIADTGASATVTKGSTAVAGETANAKTVYVAVTLKTAGGVDKVTTYTGYKNVATMTNGTVWTVAETDKAAKLVFVIGGTVTTSGSDLIYVAGTSVSNKIEDADLDDYYTYNAVIDGEIVEIMATANTYNGLYNSAAQDENDVYTSLGNTGVEKTTVSGEFKKAADEVITIAGAAKAYADDIVVYVVDTEGGIVKGSINRNYSNGTDYTIEMTYTVNDDGEVDALYIVKVANAE